jgi:uncharacterized protein YfdQ (DUF2303 family)
MKDLKDVMASPAAIDRLLQLGVVMSDPAKADVAGEPYVIVPSGFEIKTLKEFIPPSRIEQNVVLIDAGSFIEYVNRFKDADTLIFCEVNDASTPSQTGLVANPPSAASLTAVLDYHKVGIGLNVPRYCVHTCTLQLRQTVEWQTWRSKNAVRFGQVEFATFLEDNQHLFNAVRKEDSTLKGAELLELVTTLHGKRDVKFDTSVRLQNGASKLTYVDDVDVRGTSAAGSIELPSIINVGMSIFEGGQPYKVDARLKTRVEGRQIQLWYETIQMHKIVRDSIRDVVKLVAEKTSITPLLGKP